MVVVQIFVAKRDAELRLANAGVDITNDAACRPAIRKAGRKPVDRLDRLVGRAQQQGAGVRGDRAAAKSATRSH